MSSSLTLGRTCEIADGVGAPPTEDELAQLPAIRVRMAPVIEKIGPQVLEVVRDLKASGYMRLPLRERLRYRHWTPKAFLLYRQQASRRNWSTPREQTTRRRRAATSRRARSPGRLSADDEPHEPDVAVVAISAFWAEVEQRGRREAEALLDRVVRVLRETA